MTLLTISLFGKRFTAEESSSRDLAIIILAALVVGSNLFFWLAVFVLWRNLSEECETEVDVIGRIVKDCTMMTDCKSYSEEQGCQCDLSSSFLQLPGPMALLQPHGGQTHRNTCCF